MVRNIRLVVEYDGTAFHGWQRQKKAVSVQGTLESALSTVLGHPVQIVGASRTDSGCHAKAQVANLHTPARTTCERLQRSLNSLLGGSVVVLDVADVDEAFHARFDALSRTYSYIILRGVSALWKSRAWLLDQRLMKRRMDAAARLLVGEHDFASFAKRRKELDNTICIVSTARWYTWGAGHRFIIQADRFLPGMIRKAVAVMAWVGFSRLDPDVLMLMMSGHSLRSAVPLAPAEGLYLEKVTYKDFCFEPRL